MWDGPEVRVHQPGPRVRFRRGNDMLNLKHLGVALVTLLALSAQHAVAQSVYSELHETLYGSSDIGGKVTTYGYVEQTSSYSKIYGRVKGTVHLLGSEQEVGRVIASGYQSGIEAKGKVRVKAGGKTVWFKEYSSSQRKVFERVFPAFDDSESVSLAGVRFSFDTDVSVKVKLDLTWALESSSMSVALNGFALAKGFAGVSADIEAFGTTTNLVDADLTLAGQRLNFDLNVDAGGTAATCSTSSSRSSSCSRSSE